MGIYYFETEKLNYKYFPSNMKYICIFQPNKPSPKNGERRL